MLSSESSGYLFRSPGSTFRAASSNEPDSVHASSGLSQSARILYNRSTNGFGYRASICFLISCEIHIGPDIANRIRSLISPGLLIGLLPSNAAHQRPGLWPVPPACACYVAEATATRPGLKPLFEKLASYLASFGSSLRVRADNIAHFYNVDSGVIKRVVSTCEHFQFDFLLRL